MYWRLIGKRCFTILLLKLWFNSIVCEIKCIVLCGSKDLGSQSWKIYMYFKYIQLYVLFRIYIFVYILLSNTKPIHLLVFQTIASPAINLSTFRNVNISTMLASLCLLKFSELLTNFSFPLFWNFPNARCCLSLIVTLFGFLIFLFFQNV